MPVPALTPEQRAAALAKAAQARRERSEVKAKLKNGQLQIVDVFALAETVDAVGKLRVLTLLESLPGVGKARARTLIERVAIAESRRLRGLGPVQKQRLLSELGLSQREIEGGAR